MNKQSPENTRDPIGNPADGAFKSAQQRYKGPTGESAVVDKVLLTSNEENHFIVKALVRQTRRPEIGDKFSSRHGQKGVIGTIVEQQDMPFSERGISPDLIMNPHGFPSRMTVGKMIELVLAARGYTISDSALSASVLLGTDCTTRMSIAFICGAGWLGKETCP